MTKQDHVRAPVQERSQKRVSQILEAARTLIEQKGAAGMKMSEIADVADVSIGSIYQYFPNKGAIVTALAERILEANTEKNEQILSEPPKSLIHLSHITTQLLDQYYDLQRQDPVVRDIWAGYASDKELQDTEHDDTLANRDHIFEMSKHLFRDDQHENAKRTLLIIIVLGGAAVGLAVQASPEEGDRIMEEAKAMLYAVWEMSILPLGKKTES